MPDAKQCREWRRRYARGESISHLAATYDVSRPTVYKCLGDRVRDPKERRTERWYWSSPSLHDRAMEKVAQLGFRNNVGAASVGRLIDAIASGDVVCRRAK